MNAMTDRFSPVRAGVLFFIAYVLVTILAAAVTETYQHVYEPPRAHELGVGMLDAPAFAATVPYHVVIMLLIWPLFSWFYFRKRTQDGQQTLRLACTWTLSAIAVDFLGFVAVRHSWSLTPREFYVDYQPWITLIYLAIFASPWIQKTLGHRR